MDHSFYFCLVFVMLSRLCFAALWSPAGKGLTSWLLFLMSNCDFVIFPCGILGQVWYLIVLIPDLCSLSYFKQLYFPDTRCYPSSGSTKALCCHIAITTLELLRMFQHRGKSHLKRGYF